MCVLSIKRHYLCRYFKIKGNRTNRVYFLFLAKPDYLSVMYTHSLHIRLDRFETVNLINATNSANLMDNITTRVTVRSYVRSVRHNRLLFHYRATQCRH